MRVVYDPEYDMGYAIFNEDEDVYLHHTGEGFSWDEDGHIIAMDLDHLSQGIDLTDPRIPRAWAEELAQELRAKGYRVTLEPLRAAS